MNRPELVWVYYFAAAGLGLIFGSFFNVVIYRMPNDMSLGDRSRCPNCDEAIHWYDNVPLLSYAVLRGRCRGCRTPISIRYPIVEATTSGLFVLIYWWSRNILPSQMGTRPDQALTPELFIGLLMVSVVLIASVVDITHGIVPNRLMYPAMVAMLILVIGASIYRRQPGRILLSIAGAAIGAGFLMAAGLIYGALFLKRRPGDDGTEGTAPGSSPGDEDEEAEGEVEGFATGIGMGDVKLLAFTGLALGYFHWYLVIVEIFMGFLLGALATIPMLILKKKGRKDRLPFAPFLGAGAIIALVWGQQIADLYLKLLR
jgi:leader peptidase (prepilin peptidase)/N-methyltransferase